MQENFGTVVKSTGSRYLVSISKNKLEECTLRGKLRLENLKSTNPVVVGDKVKITQTNSGWVIEDILPRKNYIIRKSTNLSKQTHIIAANIDLAVILASIAVPQTSMGFIDRFLVTAEAYRIPAAVVFHKSDLLQTNEEREIQKAFVKIYTDIGYPVLETSIKDKKSIQELYSLIQGKTILLSGHSGVGKSSLINALNPNLDLKTGQVSLKHLKGKHTTTYAELLQIDDTTFVIDTPGIKEFGLVNMDKDEISHYFPEIRKFLGQCKFNNCTHINEPGCIILEELNKGTINLSRYKSYLSMINNEDFKDSIY